MGTFSIWHWLVVLVVVLVLFGGGGKISRLMGDFGKGLKSFKRNIKEEEGVDVDATTAERMAVEDQAPETPTANAQPEKDKAANS